MSIKTAVFDLETTDLAADFGVILCAVVQPDHGDLKIFRGDELNPGWKKGRSDDKALVQAISEELAQYDILCAHNGINFDLPFIQTRLARWGLPPLPAPKFIDPVKIARNKLRMRYNSLQRLLDMFGLDQKTVVSGHMWVKASLDGDTEAMDYIVDHCVKDVQMLSELLDRVKAHCKVFDQRGSGW